MTDTVDVVQGLAEYDAALVRSDAETAAVVVRRLLAEGADPVHVLLDVIGEAQRRIGSRWLTGEWTVPQEHAASAIALDLATEVAQQIESKVATNRSIILACPEQEWHALPAVLTSGVLAAAGWEVTLLGASTSTTRLTTHLADSDPAAVGLSCSVLRSIPAARRFIEASTAAGVPVLAGGPAFGPDDVRARGLGATGWAPDAREAVAALERFPRRVKAIGALPADILEEHAALEIERDQWIPDVVATSGVEVITTKDRTDSTILASVVEQLLAALGAAVLSGDPRTIDETTGWAGQALRSRGYADDTVARLIAALGDRVQDLPRSAAALRR